MTRTIILSNFSGDDSSLPQDKRECFTYVLKKANTISKPHIRCKLHVYDLLIIKFFKGRIRTNHSRPMDWSTKREGIIGNVIILTRGRVHSSVQNELVLNEILLNSVKRSTE